MAYNLRSNPDNQAVLRKGVISVDRRNAIKTVAMSTATLLLTPIQAFADVLTRSWYGSTLSLSGTSSRTPAQYYDGNNIGIEMTCTAPKQDYFYVQCCTTTGIKLARKQISYIGFTKQTWPSRGPGYYYFTFTKRRNDQITVRSQDVKTYSW